MKFSLLSQLRKESETTELLGHK